MHVPQQHYKELFALFAAIENTHEAQNLLKDILTPQEIESLAERWQIVQEIARGMPQREIARTLNVSISKVTRGSRVMKYGTGAFVHFMKKMQSNLQKVG